MSHLPPVPAGSFSGPELMSAVLLNKEQLKHRLRQFLDDDLSEVQNILQRQFRNPGMFVQDVASHVSRFQGKQIRPILTLLTAHVFQAPASGLTTARTLAETTLHITRAADNSSAVLTRYTGGYDYFLEKSGLNDDRGAVTA